MSRIDLTRAVHDLAATLPARYATEQQALTEANQLVQRFHELTAEASAEGRDVEMAVPEELETRVRKSAERLHAAQRAAFVSAYDALLPALRDEAGRLASAATDLLMLASVGQQIDALALAHWAEIPAVSAVVREHEVSVVATLHERLAALAAPKQAAPAFVPRQRISTQDILARLEKAEA